METQIRPHKLQKTTKNHEERDDQRSTKWQHLLNQDISESILRRLCLTDYLKFGLVCSSWNDMLKTAMENKQCHPNPQIPRLLICPVGLSSHNEPNPFFVDINKITVVHPKRSLYPSSQRVVGTVDGWLIVVEITKTYILPFFFNPVSRCRFCFPLIMKDRNDHRIIKMVANSAPNNNNNNHHDHGDPTFVVCVTFGRIIYCKVTDKSWSLIKVQSGGTDISSDILVIGNLLYVLGDRTRFDDIEVYNLDAPLMDAQKLVVLDPSPEVPLGDGLLGVFEDIYLAHDEVSGDLMLLAVRYDEFDMTRVLFGDFADHESIKGFRVMKMERSRTSSDGVRWIEVEDLGDCLMFLDTKNCRLISTVGLQMMENVARNCIYFAVGADITVFCLSDKKIRSFHISELDGSVQPIWYHSVWFTPKLC